MEYQPSHDHCTCTPTEYICLYTYLDLAASPDSHEPGSVRFPYIHGRLKLSYGNQTLPGSRESGEAAI